MPLRFEARLHCDGKDLGTFPYSFSSNEDEQELSTSNTPVPLIPYVFYEKQQSLQQMIQNYQLQLRFGRTHSLTHYSPSDVVFGTISSHFIKQPCSHFLSGVELFCATCCKFFACKYCHEDSECFDFVCTKIRCVKCGHEQDIAKYEAVCCECHAKLTDYECAKCLIYISNVSEYPLFHCKDCNQCVGGVSEDFITCKQCKQCVKKLYYSLHQCKDGEDLCCICHGPFDNVIRKKVTFRCKHYMHFSCWRQIGDKCPLCNRQLHEVVQRAVYNDKYLQYLLHLSTGKYDNTLAVFKCLECGLVFESFSPPCCYQAFCRSCECEPYTPEQNDELLTFKQANTILECSGCPVPVLYRDSQQIQKAFVHILNKQQFWAEFNAPRIQLFLDYCNLLDSSAVWMAVCLLLNKGYNEVDVFAGEGLRSEIQECVEQICEFLRWLT